MALSVVYRIWQDMQLSDEAINVIWREQSSMTIF
jgi:hypothetical protein